MIDFAAVRAAAGLTQQQAAARAGVTRQTWARWEAGTDEPAAERWPDLADLFDVTLPAPVSLLEARKQVGLTQEALADRVGVTASFVARVETGDFEPDFGVWGEHLGLPAETVSGLWWSVRCPRCRGLGCDHR